MRLSKLTILFALYIIVSASFMQQVWNLARVFLGRNTVIAIFIFAYLVIASGLLYCKVKAGFKSKGFLLMCIVCISGFILMMNQPYLSEKAHILEYGILGWLAMHDLSKNKKRVKGVFSALIFILMVAGLDEGWQKLLPWRVFEIRDILTNVFSGALGVISFLLK